MYHLTHDGESRRHWLSASEPYPLRQLLQKPRPETRRRDGGRGQTGSTEASDQPELSGEQIRVNPPQKDGEELHTKYYRVSATSQQNVASVWVRIYLSGDLERSRLW